MSLLDWNSIENSRHGITDSYRVPSKFIPPQSSSIKEISLDSEIEKSYNFFNTSLLPLNEFGLYLVEGGLVSSQ